MFSFTKIKPIHSLIRRCCRRKNSSYLTCSLVKTTPLIWRASFVYRNDLATGLILNLHLDNSKKLSSVYRTRTNFKNKKGNLSPVSLILSAYSFLSNSYENSSSGKEITRSMLFYTDRNK